MSTHARSAAQVFDEHLRLRQQGDFETDLAHNYAGDVRMFAASGIFRGHDGVREQYRRLQHDLRGARYQYLTRRVDGEVCFLEWAAHGDGARVDDGVDTLVVRDGRIVAQTIHYTVRH